MPIKDLKRFLGGLNTDDNPIQLPDGDFPDALNVRVGSSSEQGGVGLVETLRGELEVLLDIAAPFTTYYGSAIGGEFLYIGFEEAKIGDQVWMKKNWDDDYPGSKVYDDDEDNADKYGRLYTHNQAMAEDFCPEGYHVPIEDDIDELLVFLGGAMIAGGKMKELWTEHWKSPNLGATNSSGFKALPGGRYDAAYDLLQEMGLFWLQDEAEPLPPMATEATDITYTSFIAHWLASEGATGYRLDVATDEDFTAFVAGYEDLDVGNVLQYEVTGLMPGITYYYRVRAYNEIGSGENSNIITIVTTIIDTINIETVIAGIFSMDLQGSGDVNINWGDGSAIETVSLLGMGSVTVTHSYPTGGSFMISNVSAITHFSAINQSITNILIPNAAVNIEQINVQGNLLTSFITYPEWVNLTVFAAGTNSITALNTYATWVNLISFTVDINQILTIETHPEWTALEIFGASENLLTTIVLRPEWINIQQINLHDNFGLFDIGGTYAAWVDLRFIELTSCIIPAIDTFDTWVNFYQINVYNMPISFLEAHREWGWTTVIRIDARECDIANTIDINNILIEIDNSIKTSGYIYLEGGTNAAPTGAGITAKNNLIAKGISVTTN